MAQEQNIPNAEEVAREAASSPESEHELEELAAEMRDRDRGSEPMPADEARPAPPGPEADGAEPTAPPEPDYKDQWLRAVADLDNVRKRARRDVAAAQGRGAARLARELLPALDNFERALAAAEDQPENRDHHLTQGIRLVQKELLAALTRVGIEPESPKGEQFDPHRHEAIAQHSVEGAEPGTIIEVYQAGYRIGDDVLRPAKVVVAG
jgi:molecular chaperone GrpE